MPPIALAAVGAGGADVGGADVALVIAVQLVLITCIGVFNPLFATERLGRVPAGRVSRVLTAWSVTGTAAIAALTALWGLLATLIGTRAAIGAAGLLLLATPKLLPALREGVEQTS